MPVRFAGYQTNLSPVSQGQVSQIKWGNFNLKLYRFAETERKECFRYMHNV